MQNIGAVARACNCFECETLRVVDPSCPITTRSALNAAMGGQRLLWKTEECADVADAVNDCAYSVAFDRWTEGEHSIDRTGMRRRCFFRAAPKLVRYACAWLPPCRWRNEGRLHICVSPREGSRGSRFLEQTRSS